MNHLRILAAVCALGALAACAESPTLGTAPGGARRDGGFTYGSGHLTEGGGGITSTSTTTAAAGSAGTVEECDDVEFGGMTYGSGHFAGPGICDS